MSVRLDKARQGLLEKRASFPFLTLLVTSSNLEFVLTRGVGMHTIFGLSVDVGIGNYLDHISKIAKRELKKMI